MTTQQSREPAPYEAGPPRPRQTTRPTPNGGMERVIEPRVAGPRSETASELGRPRGGPPRPKGVR